MKLIHWLAQFEPIINQIWVFTLTATVILYIVCNLLPSRIVGQYLPLHDVFKPKTNVDLNFQSIGYAMLHTTWATKITHSTLIIEAMLWFVMFESWHWSIPLMALLLILIQSVWIGDKRFGLFFMLMGVITFGAALYVIQLLGVSNATLVAKVVLMLGGLMRMLSHSAELIPPLLINQTDQFVKLTAKNINGKVLLSSPIGYVAEFSSGLPNRLLPVQVNYIYQMVLGIKPTTTLPWAAIETSAQKALVGGYSALASLRKYYGSVVGGK
ncbi:MAG: hypothetical protein R2822_15270 [Spirosomataceae bacterium]